MGEGFITKTIHLFEETKPNTFSKWVDRDNEPVKRTVMLVDTTLPSKERLPKKMHGTLVIIVTDVDYVDLVDKYSDTMLDDLNVIGDVSEASRRFLESLLKHNKKRARNKLSQEVKKEKHRDYVKSKYDPRVKECKVCNEPMVGKNLTCKKCLDSNVKYCNTCGEIKGLVDFAVINTGSKEGVVVSKCRPCQLAYAEFHRNKIKALKELK